MGSPSSSVREAKRVLGQRLREIRQDAGLTARALAALAGWHESKCSRIENGKASPSDADIRAWTVHCGAEDQTADLLATARDIEGMYVEWSRRDRNGLRQIQESDIPLYLRTQRFRIYEPGVMPGLVQTPAYAAALMRAIVAFYEIPDDTEQAVAVRVARQRVLREGDHTFAFLLEESTLRARIGGPEVMAAQLGHLLTVASLPQVSLGIIPSSIDRGMWPVEGFWIFDDERVKVELATAEVTVTQPREIAIYARTFAALAEMAVYGSDMRKLITAAIDALG